MSPPSGGAAETELVVRLGRGDESALAPLYDRMAPLAYGLALRIAGEARLAQDVVQESFLRVWQHAGRFDPRRGSAAAWVLRIVRNAAIDQRRAEVARERARQRACDPDLARDSSEAPDRQLARDRRWAALHSALDELPEDQRRAIEISYFQGLSHAEIAAREGIPLGTVKTRIRHGVSRLRRLAELGRLHD